MSLKLQQTGDGSHTLYNEQLDETYHSHHGALAEARHVFIKEGLEHIGKQGVKLLEVGMGTGLNVLLSIEHARDNGLNVEYTTLEPYPIDLPIIEKLNYIQLIGDRWGEDFQKIHTSEWGLPVDFKGLNLTKHKATLQEVKLPHNYFDVIYFDAFAPRKQPDVWELENIKKCFDLLVSGGVLVTYCANGQFRRDVKAAGFIMNSIPGPPGKREMTRAVKP